MIFLVSCPFGLSSLLGKEISHLGLTANNTFDTGIYVNGDYNDMMKINLWSRIANKIYLQLGSGICSDFDGLFDLISKINWDNYINQGQNIIVNVNSKNSKLESTRTIQSIANKAIFKKISDTKRREIDQSKPNVDVLITINNNQASIFINTSGNSLHERGYRKQTLDAPIKENLAAAMVLLSRWKFNSVFWDPFCGSGTIAIEAAMIAKNIAPGINRNFAFELWKDTNIESLQKLKEEAKNKIFKDKKHQIFASDIDERAIIIAEKNSKNIGVPLDITFFRHNFLEPVCNVSPDTIISNPPYGKRLIDKDLNNLYKFLINKIQNIQNGGFITLYKECKQYFDGQWTSKKIFNGPDECMFYSKK